MTTNGKRGSVARTLLVVLTALALAVFLPACGDDDDNGAGPDDGGDQPAANEVWMENSSFVPETRTVSLGTTVTWINKDAVVHTVRSGTPMSPTGLFQSGNVDADQSFSFTFDTAGTYHYYCSIHPVDMQGTIVVEP